MAQRILRALLGRRDREDVNARGVRPMSVREIHQPERKAEQDTFRLTVVGCGDAFGSGGRLQSSYHLETAQGQMLLDCGATALIGMNRAKLDPNAVGCILISHLHGDHFSGLVWWLMHSHYVSNRMTPLTIVGPAGIQERVAATAEALFPGSSALDLRYRLEYRECANRVPLEIGGLKVIPFHAVHESGAPAHAFRIEGGGRSLGFSGDTEWTDDLALCARGTDLFIVDCFGYDADIGCHMSWKTVSSRLDALQARRFMLTHMGPEMLARTGEVRDPRIIVAEDGLVLDLAGQQASLACAGSS